jgi:hypothetical protein
MDDDQWHAAYVVSEDSQFLNIFTDCLGADSKKKLRDEYRLELLSRIPGKPGEPTLSAVKRALEANSKSI